MQNSRKMLIKKNKPGGSETYEIRPRKSGKNKQAVSESCVSFGRSFFNFNALSGNQS